MDFVFLSTQGWNEMGGVGRPIHFFARELLARGHSVLFVEVVKSEHVAPQKNLRVVSFAELGYDETALRRAWFGLDAQIDTRETLARALAEFETASAERVVVYGDPFVPFLEWFSLFRERGYKIVYDALDDFEAFSEIGLYFVNVHAEKFLVAHSDLVLAVSTTLVEKLSSWEPRAPIRLLRQGFDATLFRAARTERSPQRSEPQERNGVRSVPEPQRSMAQERNGVRSVPEPQRSEPQERNGVRSVPEPQRSMAQGDAAASVPYIFGFWGHVNAFNVDAALIEHVARARPHWTIELLGPIDVDANLPRVEERLRALSNVRLLGRVAHQELPRHLQTFDVALIPFPNNTFNRARDPLKVYEYLSGYKPVVASHTPQLANMPYVYLADSPQEFLEMLERAANISVDRSVIDAYLENCTWGARLDQLLAWLQEISLSTNHTVFSLSEMETNTSAPKNVQQYIARTEQLLQERTEYIRALERDAQAKQAHIHRLQGFNPFWFIKHLFSRK